MDVVVIEDIEQGKIVKQPRSKIMDALARHFNHYSDIVSSYSPAAGEALAQDTDKTIPQRDDL